MAKAKQTPKVNLLVAPLLIWLVLIALATSLHVVQHGIALPFGWKPPTVYAVVPAMCDRALDTFGFPFQTSRPNEVLFGGCTNDTNAIASFLNLLFLLGLIIVPVIAPLTIARHQNKRKHD